MENIEHKMKRLIQYYKRITGSSDPVKIAESAGIRIAIVPLGEIAGNYILLKRKRWIFINDNIPSDSPLFKVVVAHELGHALLHRKENCAFIKKKPCYSHPELNAKQIYLLLICLLQTIFF